MAWCRKMMKKTVLDSLKKWKKMGILNFDKTQLPDSALKARLIIPKNYTNYGYLVYSNFERFAWRNIQYW